MMNRGRAHLIAQLPGPPLGPPPSRLSADQVRAWHDVCELVATTAGDVLRRSDTMLIEHIAVSLAIWRQLVSEAEQQGVSLASLGVRPNIRRLLRALGRCFVPMPARRRLLFPESSRPR